jgi:UDP-glucuronate 4-epimerase
VLDHPPAQGGHEVYNIGDNDPVGLMEMISTLEAALGIEAKKVFLPMQPGDVPDTWADVSALRRDVGYAPSTAVDEGVARFARWYVDFYGV